MLHQFARPNCELRRCQRSRQAINLIWRQGFPVCHLDEDRPRIFGQIEVVPGAEEHLRVLLAVDLAVFAVPLWNDLAVVPDLVRGAAKGPVVNRIAVAIPTDDLGITQRKA